MERTNHLHRLVLRAKRKLNLLIYQTRRTSTLICCSRSMNSSLRADIIKRSHKLRKLNRAAVSRGALEIKEETTAVRQMRINRKVIARSLARNGRWENNHRKRGWMLARSTIVPSWIQERIWIWPRRMRLSLSMDSQPTCYPTNGWLISWSNSREISNLQVFHSSVSTGQRSSIFSFHPMIGHPQQMPKWLRASKCANIAPLSSTWTVVYAKCALIPK